jgi:hypothetical protein
LRSALTWIDVIVAAMLIVCGTAAWKYADPAVRHALLDHPPEKDGYLRAEDVRTRELKVESAKAELTAVHTKAIEQGFVGEAAAAPFRGRIPSLERALIAAEKEAFEARRAALERFEADDFRFQVKHRSITLLVAIALAIVTFIALRILATLTAGEQLNVHWGDAARIASCVLAPIFGFETAGALGAVIGGAMALLLLVRL